MNATRTPAAQGISHVRQSSLVQVQIHQESTRRQYGLHSRAMELGWKVDQIEVVDEDLGQSASEIGRLRPGFQRLLAGMVSGEVGAILSVEVSRLARQDSEVHRVEIKVGAKAENKAPLRLRDEPQGRRTY